MLDEGTVRASRSLREDFAETLRQAGFKRSSRLLREGFAEPPRCLSGESPSRRHRGGFMNPSFEPSWTLQMGSTKNPKPGNPFEGQFSSPEARMVVEPRMQFLGLCSFNARRKSRFLVLGAKKRRFFGAPKKKKKRQKIFWGGRKSYLAAEHHNEAAPKKKKKPKFFCLGAEKYCSL